MSSSIFNDSWYRIAGLRVSLLLNVSVQEQTYRGKIWFVLKDTYNQNFFRVSPETCQFIEALSTQYTIQEIWERFVEDHPSQAPSREEVTLIISQLHASNLLFFQNDANNTEIFKRITATRHKEFLSKFTSILFFKIPLWNPNDWLTSVYQRLKQIPSTLILLLCAAVVGLGVITAVSHTDTLFDKSQGIISIDNLPWLYVCLSFMKLLHETAHGLLCKKYGGQVKTFGLMFLLFTPLPFIDVTSSWSFPNRWHRVYVGVAGMAVELFIAGLSAWLWAHTGAGLLNSIFFNLMFIGSVSSLLFNGNPLLRFDAYFILSDYLGIPNLYLKAQKQCLYFANRYILGTAGAQPVAIDSREAKILYTYGVASFLYLMVVTLGIALFLLDKWFPLGVFALLVTLLTKAILPFWKLLKHLNNPVTQPNRTQAISATLGLALVASLLAAFVPLPYSIKSPGILEAQQFKIYYTESDGILDQILVNNGDMVKSGQVIALLKNQDLQRDLSIIQSELQAADIEYRVALNQSWVDIGSTLQRFDSLQQQANELKRRLDLLSIRAEFDGKWISPNLQQLQGNWIRRGQIVGHLINNHSYRFSAVISQEQANDIFRSKFSTGQIMVAGQSEDIITVDRFATIPYQTDKLTSASLGWMGGGDIPIQVEDKGGNVAKESFFLLYGFLPEKLPASILPLHGLTGIIRITLPSKPLTYQVRQFFLQLVQKRYGI